jgi:hypothetical protein
MWAGWGAYLSVGTVQLCVYSVQKHLSHTLHSTRIFKCSSGRRIWDWYFSLTSHSIKQVLTSNPALPFSFVFPQFLNPQVSRSVKWLFKKRPAFSSDITWC